MGAVKRRFLDSATGDYIVENGGPREDTTHTSTVVILVTMEHGSCPVAPDAGNKLFSRMGKLGPGAEGEAEAWTREALKPLTNPRRITDLEVTATIEGSSVCLVIEFKDRAGNEQTVRVRLPRGVLDAA